MKNTNLLTISDIAKATSLPASTVRYYKDNYKEFYPSQNLRGKRYPIYENQCLKVTEIIRDMYNDGKEKHDIFKRLEGEFQPLIDLSDDDTSDNDKGSKTTAKGQPTNNAVATIDSQNKILYRLGLQQQEWIQNQDNLLEHYRKQTGNQKEVIQALEQDNKELKKEVERLSENIGNKEIEIKDLKKKLDPSLFKKLFG